MTVNAVTSPVPDRGRGFTLMLAGKVKGMHRPRVSNIGGQARMRTETVDREAMNDINTVWLEAGSPRLEGPITVSILCEVAHPKSHYGTGRNAGMLKTSAPALPTVKPDLDNVAKLVMDALNGRAYRDDVDVVCLIVRRRWSDDSFERTIVRVEQVIA